MGSYEVRDVLLSVAATVEGWSFELAGPPGGDPKPAPAPKCTPGGSITNSGGPPTRCKPGGSITHSGGPPGPKDPAPGPKEPAEPSQSLDGAAFEADVLAALLTDLRAAGPGASAQG